MSNLAKPVPQQLKIEKAREMLAACRRVDEAKSIRDQAVAIRIYFRQQNASREAQNDAAEIKVRAERRIGELTRVLEKAPSPKTGKAGPGRGKRAGTKDMFSKGRALKEIGVSRQQASEFERIASVPERHFEAFIRQQRSDPTGEITTMAILKEARMTQRAAKHRQQVANVKRFRWPTGKFPVISVDPAWKFDKRAEDETHRDGAGYPRMTVEEVCRLKIPSADDCILFLWCPNALVAEGVHVRVLQAWGFKPILCATWTKDKMGLGDWMRGNTEQYILAIRGKPVVNLTNQTTGNTWPYCGPSRKPPEFFETMAELCPATPRLEMFACEEHEGWVAAGSEVQAEGL